MLGEVWLSARPGLERMVTLCCPTATLPGGPAAPRELGRSLHGLRDIPAS